MEKKKSEILKEQYFEQTRIENIEEAVGKYLNIKARVIEAGGGDLTEHEVGSLSMAIAIEDSIFDCCRDAWKCAPNPDAIRCVIR